MLGMREVLVYPHGSKYVIIGGNMRFQACKELQFETVPCKVLDKDTTAEQLRAITIKDNIGFGEHDWELLANEWDAVELEEWGLEVPNIDNEIKEAEQKEKSTMTISFGDADELQKAHIEIQEILDRKFPKATIK
jgi:ParB-like chromosome segregation protein Spo0J